VKQHFVVSTPPSIDAVDAARVEGSEPRKKPRPPTVKVRNVLDLRINMHENYFLLLSKALFLAPQAVW